MSASFLNHWLRGIGLAALALVSTACTSAASASLPAPHPEAGAWTLGEASGAFLGLQVEANEAGTLEALESDPGVRVLRVVENSPAAHQGLQVGDVLLSFAGAPLGDPVALDVLLANAESGDEVSLNVRRGDSVFELNVTLAGGDGMPTSPPELLYIADPARTRAGWRSTPRGVVLVALTSDSPLHAAKLDVGSVVLSLNGNALRSAGELVRRAQALAPGTRVKLVALNAAGERRDVSIKLFDVPTRVTRSRVPVLWSYEAEADGSSTDLHLLDFWFLELFQFHQRTNEREWVLLEVFGYELFAWGSGIGELSE